MHCCVQAVVFIFRISLKLFCALLSCSTSSGGFVAWGITRMHCPLGQPRLLPVMALPAQALRELRNLRQCLSMQDHVLCWPRGA